MEKEEIVVVAKKRDIITRPKDVRAEGNIPGVLYGQKEDPTPVLVEYQEFRKAYRITGDSTMMYLDLDGKKIPTLIHDVQYDPVYDDYTHLDFYQVDENKPVKTSIPITLEGLAPAVKNLQGVLVAPTDHLEIECLPKHLIHDIVIDVTGIKDFHTAVHVSDLEINNDKNITILTSPDTVLASVSPPKGEEEEIEETTEGEDDEKKEGEGEGDAKKDEK